MKRILTLFSFVLLSSTLLSQVAIPPAVGEGTITDPYEIASLENLYWITAGDSIVPDPDQETRWSSHYIQVADIDAGDTESWFFDEYQGWTPIGFWSVDFQKPFIGSYNGQHHTIYGIFIYNPNMSHLGLFGYTEGAVIKNLGVISANITGYNILGILSGWTNQATEVTNCYSTGYVQGHGIYAGGLIGINEWSTISTSHSSAQVNGTQYSGGLVGFSRYSSLIQDSYSTGNVTGTEGLIGGLVACNHHSSHIIRCYSTGSVFGQSNRVGGLVGWNHMDALISYSFSTGDVTGNFYVGGLVGDNYLSNITRSYSTGHVNAYYDLVGGLVGISQYNSLISDCYSKGFVVGANFAGGLVGENDNSKIVHCYAIGSIDANMNIGGLVGSVLTGEHFADINNYWNSETTGLTSSEMGEARTTEEMTYPHAANTYVDWDFIDIWCVDDAYAVNDGYPYHLDPTLYTEDLISVDEPFILSNYPNPFNPETKISFTLSSQEQVQLIIYNIKGQRVRTLLNDRLETGEHSVIWNGRDETGKLMPSGVYLYSLVRDRFSQSRKMLLLK